MGLGSPKRYDIAPHIRVSFVFLSYLTENTSLHVLLYENINLGQKRNVLKFSSPFLASLSIYISSAVVSDQYYVFSAKDDG